MKNSPLRSVFGLALLTIISTSAPAAAPADNPPSTEKLKSAVYEWKNLPVAPTSGGERRAVFDGPTATVEKVHCHISTLNPGERSGEPRKHLQEEVIYVKEGQVEANYDGHVQTAGPGSVIFFAAGATTFLRNAGSSPASYLVVYYITPLTPKS